VIFNLPDFPDGAKARVASDERQWMLQTLRIVKGEERWDNLGYYTGRNTKLSNELFAGVTNAVQAYLELYMRRSRAEGLDQAKVVCTSLLRDLTNLFPAGTIRPMEVWRGE
jgi:hypothetical protein